jgi:hypothetical protein
VPGWGQHSFGDTPILSKKDLMPRRKVTCDWVFIAILVMSGVLLALSMMVLASVQPSAGLRVLMIVFVIAYFGLLYLQDRRIGDK